LQVALLANDGFAPAATAFATALCDRLQCDRVALGWRKRDCSTVVALSYGADIDPRQPLLERIAAAMDEALEQGSTITLPQPGEARQVVLAHRELAGAPPRAVCTVILADHTRPLGALTLERARSAFSREETDFCEHAAALAAPLLALKCGAERSWLALSGEALRRAAARGGRQTRLALAAAAAVAAALLFVPLPYHVSAPARLEGSVQRIVAAPADGYLEQVNVRPGDTVKAGQVLAELATQELEAERLKRQSELAQHENVYKAALARYDRTQLVINQARAAEARAQLALIEQQLSRAQLRAPFDGAVIKGDLAQQLGAPVQRGEALLTIAPDQRFRLIVEVDERDIAPLRPGLSGKLALAAAPEAVLDFTVARVLPVAVADDGRNFFEVEGTLDAGGRHLRPGLRGVAKILAGRRSAAWMACHRVIDWLRLTLWSIGV
jgi:RND family efflux transporter MFP subunit